MKKIYFIFVVVVLFQTISFGQQKGVTHFQNEKQDGERGNTYAVVVGISDYQDPAIPDLRFADKDAEAFANFLRSEAGGKLDDDHLKVLINSKATMAQFAIQLDWLLEIAKENDRVFIYFSGHGDVEKKTITQPGFLLCWDAPAQVYMSGGAFALPMLQEVISTLSVQNKANVIVITDACHSGKLSGSSINGNQLTNSNLAKQYANEVKILSCQPNEYSIEGEQWGGGRGAFSYHFIDALYGMADQNNDQLISIGEIGRYLEDHVTPEVAPQKQEPIILGSKSEILSPVIPNLLSQIRKSKSSQFPVFASTESRGLEEEILAGVDTSIRIIYQLFKESLKEKKFLEPSLACTEYYYQQLIKETGLTRLHSTVKRNYAAALQDDAQQVMNKWFKNDKDELSLSKKSKKEKYQSYPDYLDRAAQLLGPNHYMYRDLQARKFFFQGFLLAMENQTPNPIAGAAALEKFKTALLYQYDMPQVYWQISLIFGYHILQPDSLEFYTQKAIELAPSWVSPYDWASFFMVNRFGLFNRAKYYLERGSALDSNNLGIIGNWAIYYERTNQFLKAEKQYKKIELIDSNISYHNNFGTLYANYGFLKNAEIQFRKAIQLDSTNDWACRNLGFICLLSQRFIEAEKIYLKSIQLDSLHEESYLRLGEIYEKTNRPILAQKQYRKVLELVPVFNDAMQMYLVARSWLGLGQIKNMKRCIEEGFKKWPEDVFVPYYAGCIYAIADDEQTALVYLKEALDKGFSEYNSLMNDPEYLKIRNREGFKTLVQKYFPEQNKNK